MPPNNDNTTHQHPWLEKRALYDSNNGANLSKQLPPEKTKKLWLVHGAWYDLKSFKHPGGNWWISSTRGQDITDLVETHHMFPPEKISNILKKYYVGDAGKDYKSYFDYKDNGFYRTLKRRCWEALRNASKDSSSITNATPLFKSQCIFVFILHCICFLLTIYYNSSIYACFTGVTIAALHGIGHNYLHQKDSIYMWFAILGGWKIKRNRISHAISHHPQPNTNWDLEILGLEPWLYNMVDRPANSRLVIIYGPLLCMSGHLLDIILLWRNILLNIEPFEMEYISNMLQLFILCYFNGMVNGIKLFIIMFLIFGAIDSYAGYPLHHTELAWTVGSKKHEQKRDLLAHLVATTVDYNTEVNRNGFIFWRNMFIYELMPNHLIHHCFPTLDCSKFEIIKTTFDETLVEFGLKQKLLPMPAIYFGMWPAWLRK